MQAKTTLRNTVLGIGFCLLLASVSPAGEEAPQVHNYKEGQLGWINLGIGASSFGFSQGGSYSQQIWKGILSTRFIHNTEFDFLNIIDETVWDLGLLYGGMVKSKYWIASISTGLSLVGGVQQGKLLYREENWLRTPHYKKDKFQTIGIPIEFQMFITLVKDPKNVSIGFGLYGFRNFNSEEPFGGGLVCVQFGKLW
ncbi:MAG: hypothetical protein P9X24_10450 [Candidatus Hatepunaea meridiana]|nr:hypothetical protein [Candidatus Hatepunaea meridiana]